MYVEVKILDKYYTVAELSESLKIPIETVRFWLRSGELKGIRLGRHWRVKEDDLKQFLESKENEQKR